MRATERAVTGTAQAPQEPAMRATITAVGARFVARMAGSYGAGEP